MNRSSQPGERGAAQIRQLVGAGAALWFVVWAATAAFAQGTPSAPAQTAPNAPAQTAPNASGSGAIEPGQAVGNYRLGQDVTQLVTTLGPIHSEDDIPGSTLTGYYWPLKRIGAIADKNTKKIVALVVSLDEGYRTDKGVSAGTDMDTVRTAYGHEDSVDSHEDDDTLVYDSLGVAFVVDKSGALGSRVSVIFVFGSGQYKKIFQQDDNSSGGG
jgi:hypothetical protein